MSKKRKKKIPDIDSGFGLIDTHCHLDMQYYEKDLDEILFSAQVHGVTAVISIGIDLNSSKAAVNIARRHDMVKATVGVHPHDVSNLSDGYLQKISELIDHNQDYIVGYGEIGLDYVKKYSPIETQKKFFRNQLALAKNHNLPVVIHDREAHDDTLKILKEFSPFEKGGVMHCFSGNLDLAHEAVDLGFLVSIPGIVTFKNAHTLKDVASNIPLDSLILETDGPFLAPEPYRGKRNEPLYLLYTAAEVAQLRNMTIEKIAEETSRNATRLFNFTVPRRR